MKKYSLPFWYTMAVLFTGALLIPHLLWDDLGYYSLSLTQYSPLLSTFLLLWIEHDKGNVSGIKENIRFNKNYIFWYLLSAIIPVALVCASSPVLSSLFDSPYKAWNGTPIFYILSFAAMLLGSIGEEVGWRGYLQPVLNRKTSPFVSSIVVGGLWGIWHLNYAGDIVFWLLFIVATMELSIMLTFLMGRANGNLWIAIIFHAFFNFANRVFLQERFVVNLLLIWIVIFGLFSGIVIIIDKKHMFNKCEKKH